MIRGPFNFWEPTSRSLAKLIYEAKDFPHFVSKYIMAWGVSYVIDNVVLENTVICLQCMIVHFCSEIECLQDRLMVECRTSFLSLLSSALLVFGTAPYQGLDTE